MKPIRCTVDTTLKYDTLECCRHRDVISDDDIIIEGDTIQCRHYVRIDGRATGRSRDRVIGGKYTEQSIVREIASHAAMELGIE